MAYVEGLASPRDGAAPLLPQMICKSAHVENLASSRDGGAPLLPQMCHVNGMTVYVMRTVDGFAKYSLPGIVTKVKEEEIVREEELEEVRDSLFPMREKVSTLLTPVVLEPKALVNVYKLLEGGGMVVAEQGEKEVEEEMELMRRLEEMAEQEDKRVEEEMELRRRLEEVEEEEEGDSTTRDSGFECKDLTSSRARTSSTATTARTSSMARTTSRTTATLAKEVEAFL